MNKPNTRNTKTILFDLDGTLLDTAPDFVFALNNLLATKGLPAISANKIRTAICDGSTGLIELGFNLTEEDEDFELFRRELLELYSENLTRYTRPFFGIEEVLNIISEKKIEWGIVTNKPGWLTIPLLEQIKFIPAPTIVVSGDTLTVTKPDPAPLLHACKKLDVATNECIFVGDSEFDVKAGKKAGILTIVAEYGYCKNTLQAQSWHADAYIKSPLDLLDWI